jgi:hypothetical protein
MHVMCIHANERPHRILSNLRIGARFNVEVVQSLSRRFQIIPLVATWQLKTYWYMWVCAWNTLTDQDWLCTKPSPLRVHDRLFL